MDVNVVTRPVVFLVGDVTVLRAQVECRHGCLVKIDVVDTVN